MLKNRRNDLALTFLELDPKKTGFTNLEEFEKVIQKLGISESILTTQDIKNLYEKNKFDSVKLSYTDFLDSLKEFKLEYDQEYKEFESSKKKRDSSIFQTNQDPTTKIDKTPKIYDCRDLPINLIQNVYSKSKKVGRAIQRFFPNKDDFCQYLTNSMNIPKEDVEKLHVSQGEFKNMVDKLFKKFDVNYLDNRDFEGFLSSVLYNKNGYTNYKEISKTIYE